MYRGRIIALLLIVCIFISFMPAASAQESMDANEKAAALNRLGLIDGDGKGNYGLDKNLKKYESIVFIVKLLGKAKDFEANKGNLSPSSFTDVKSSAWYAPYISYSEQYQITTGIGNNKFGVDQNLSEQAFLIMVMKVLGYTGPEDFSWNKTVFKKAYEIGLVQDSAYLDKTTDNSSYTRNEVVKVMYTALGLKPKGSSMTLIQQLVNSGAIDRETAASTGILKDTVVTKVNQVIAQNAKKVRVELSEVINSIDSNSISIYETNNKNNTLNVSINSHSGNALVLDTSTQIENLSYTIEINNAVDMEGNTIPVISGQFNGYKIVAIKSDLFKISMAEQISRSEIVVYFTQPVNENIEFSPNYEIDCNGEVFARGDDLKVSLAGDSYSAAVALKSKVFTSGTEYVIKLSGGLVGSYGVALGDGNGDQYSFISKDMGDSKLILNSINAINSKAIKLNFNRKINSTLAQQIYNYSITDSENNPIQIEKAFVINDSGSEGKSVVLRLKTIIDKNKSYGIMINRINDISKQYSIEEQSFTFNGTYSNQSSLTVTDVNVDDAYSISIAFDRPVDTKSALDINNYSMTDITYSNKFAPSAVRFTSIDQKTVKLFFKEVNKLVVNRPYTIKIPSTFQDYSGETLSGTIEKTFLVRAADDMKPNIKEAEIIGSNAVKVTFNKEISVDVPNASPQNYMLDYIDKDSSYKKYPIAITYIDNFNVILLFDKLDKTVQYNLYCKSVKDFGGNETTLDEGKRFTVTLGE